MLSEAEKVRKLREVFVKHFSQEFTHKIDIVTNRDLGFEAAYTRLSRFDAYLHRRLIGGGWYKPANRHKRQYSVWIPEGLERNAHWHGVIQLRVFGEGELREAAYESVADMNAGLTLDIKRLDELESRTNGVGYMTKRIRKKDDFDYLRLFPPANKA